jgi:hypothetical protein
MITLPAVPFRYDSRVLTLLIPPEFEDITEAMATKCRHGYLKIGISKPGRPRTTGERSQNHAINGYCQQIAVETGQDFETVKQAMKRMAIGAGYPFRTEAMTGEVIPFSESEIDSTQAAVLIQTIKRFAAEYQIRLRDYET